ncbi:MAG TPA: hypothetical protein EYP11_04710 [Aquificaceae bacterium]|nr:hypothetical protein [Aquificaceae bacterium]
MSALAEKVRFIKERLLDPFNVEGLDRDMEELCELMSTAKKEELIKVAKDFAQIKVLLGRNIGIVSGALELLIRRHGSVFSRRV